MQINYLAPPYRVDLNRIASVRHGWSEERLRVARCRICSDSRSRTRMRICDGTVYSMVCVREHRGICSNRSSRVYFAAMDAERPQVPDTVVVS